MGGRSSPEKTTRSSERISMLTKQECVSSVTGLRSSKQILNTTGHFMFRTEGAGVQGEGFGMMFWGQSAAKLKAGSAESATESSMDRIPLSGKQFSLQLDRYWSMVAVKFQLKRIYRRVEIWH